MGVEILLACVSMLVAIVGTLKKDPTKNEQRVLITFAVLIAVGTAIKAHSDENDKEFLQKLLISSSSPPESAYREMADEIGVVSEAKGMEDVYCYHYADGMTCLLDDGQKTKHALLVLDRSEVANLYANQMRHVSNDKYIKAAYESKYNLAESPDEGFGDRLGILGEAVFRTMFGHYPDSYDSDYTNGVQIFFADDKGRKWVANIPINELKGLPLANGSEVLFPKFEKRFHESFRNPQPAKVENDGGSTASK